MISFALRHRFPGIALDMAFVAPTPGAVVLFGPSGSGKSTAVAAMAGLLRGGSGRLEVDGEVLWDSAAGIDRPPERRRIGLVFQEARLFPHLRVAANLRYGLRRAAGDARGIGFDEVVALLDIAPLLGRRPHTLSGGERQRVAIGRALLSQPRLLLLDEPLSGLDAARKAEILPYLVRLKTHLGVPLVYVTHSMEELLHIADTLVLIEAGRVVEAGPLAELSGRGDLPLARRDDAGAVLDMAVEANDRDRHLSRLSAGGLTLEVPLVAAAPGARLRVRIPAREVILATDAPSAVSVHNILGGVVRAVHPDPTRHSALVEIAVGDQVVLARVTRDAVSRLALAPARDVLALVKSMSVDVLR